MKKSTLKWLFLLPAALYLYMVIKLTFLKDGIRLETNVYRIMPFNSVYEYKQGLKSAASLIMNYAGNIAMFFPFGIFLPVFFKKLNFWKTVLLGLLFSLLIELLQHTMSSGYADVDDIIMNTLGAALGAFTFFYIFMGKKRSKASYILSLVLILLLEAGSCICIWRYAPNLLPENAISVNGMIAGKSVDEYDVRVKCYKMSHGDVFVIDSHLLLPPYPFLIIRNMKNGAPMKAVTMPRGSSAAPWTLRA